MRKVGSKLKTHLPKQNKIKVQKEIQQVHTQKPSTLEKTPAKDFFDYSTEENGYFLHKDTDGNILGIIRTKFSR